jgi:hypothetical protein
MRQPLEFWQHPWLRNLQVAGDEHVPEIDLQQRTTILI